MVDSNVRFTAVVTGGAAGIGAEICRSFVDAGFRVICLDLDPPGWSHERLVAAQVDLTDDVATAQAADAIAAQYAITHFVHNAGAIRASLVERVEPADLAALARLHLGAPLILLKAFLPAMKAGQYGRVVLMSSRAALGLATRTAYSATKAGMIGMTRTWALELAKHGITVNAIAPGPIGATEMFQANTPKEAEARLIATIPVGRLGEPSDVVNAVRFFADERSGFVTGQTLYVCGGASIGTAPV